MMDFREHMDLWVSIKKGLEEKTIMSKETFELYLIDMMDYWKILEKED